MLAIDYREYEKIRKWADDGADSALVEIVNASGSTPRETGAAMAVTADSMAGTIGGGQLEWLAMAEARKLLESDRNGQSLSIPLGPNIGQCCGGRVDLVITRIDSARLDDLRTAAIASRNRQPEVYIFGAGHTGLALAVALAPLPFRIHLTDSRSEAPVTGDDRIEQTANALPESIVERAATGSAYAIMTHEHSLDFLIAAEILKRGDATYCGLIGSATKRQLFVRWLADNGYDPASAERLTCPIGGSAVRDKRPTVIAALTVAEIVSAFHKVQSDSTK